MDSDGHGFWLIYELLTGTLSFRIFDSDSTHALGSILLRMTTRGTGDELLPLLRMLEAERDLASAMPKFKDSRSKTLKMFKGKVGQHAQRPLNRTHNCPVNHILKCILDRTHNRTHNRFLNHTLNRPPTSAQPSPSPLSLPPLPQVGIGSH